MITPELAVRIRRRGLPLSTDENHYTVPRLAEIAKRQGKLLVEMEQLLAEVEQLDNEIIKLAPDMQAEPVEDGDGIE